MFVGTDTNYAFGQIIENKDNFSVKAPVFSKCFTSVNHKGYRFIHEPGAIHAPEADINDQVLISIFNGSAAVNYPAGEYAEVSALGTVAVRLDMIPESIPLKEIPYYHIIIPVEEIETGTRFWLVVKMTKEVELFPMNQPYYLEYDNLTDTQPTSAEAPSGGGDTQFVKLNIKIVNNKVVSNDSARSILDTVKSANGEFYYFEFSGEEIQESGYLPNVKYFIQQYYDDSDNSEFVLFCSALTIADSEITQNALKIITEVSADTDSFVLIQGSL